MDLQLTRIFHPHPISFIRAHVGRSWWSYRPTRAREEHGDVGTGYPAVENPGGGKCGTGGNPVGPLAEDGSNLLA